MHKRRNKGEKNVYKHIKEILTLRSHQAKLSDVFVSHISESETAQDSPIYIYFNLKCLNKILILNKLTSTKHFLFC